jgi:hypothetical protein
LLLKTLRRLHWGERWFKIPICIQERVRRVVGALGAAFAIAGIVSSITGCAVALPPLTITEDLYSSIASTGGDKVAEQTYVVFVRRAGAFVQIPYQLYDGEEMISAGQGNNLCHIYETSAGKHILGLSFVAGTGTAGNIPRLRFRFIEGDLAPRKVYYLSINIGDSFLGGFVGGLQPISERLNNDKELPNWLATCKLVKFDAALARKQWVEPNSADFKPMFREAFSEWKDRTKKEALMTEDGFNQFVTATVPR